MQNEYTEEEYEEYSEETSERYDIEDEIGTEYLTGDGNECQRTSICDRMDEKSVRLTFMNYKMNGTYIMKSMSKGVK